MARRKNTHCFEPDTVPVHRATRYHLSEHHPESVAERGRLLRQEVIEAERVLGQPLSVDVVRHFFPDIEQRCGVTLEWVMQRIESLRAGHGVTARTWTRLIPLVWRLPHWSWCLAIPYPPKNIAVRVSLENDRGIRADGSVIPFPPVPPKEAS